MSKRKKIFVWILGSLGVLLVVLLAFQIIVPRLINLESIKSKILASVSEKIGGEVRSQKIGLSFFPYPHAVIDQVRLSIPGKVSGTVESLGVYVKIRPLFSGKLHPAEIQLESPDFKVRLPEKLEGSKEGNKPTLSADVKKALSQALAPLASDAPDLIAKVENGRLDISKGNKSLFFFRNISTRIVFPPKGLRIKLTCASNLWDRVEVGGILDSEHLTGEGRVALMNFQPHKLTAYLIPDAPYQLVDSQVNLSLGLHMDSLQAFQADVAGSFPNLSIHRGKEEIVIKSRNLKGRFHFDEAKMAVSLSELILDYPRLNMTGNFSMEKTSPRFRVILEGKEVDLSSVRKTALALAGDDPSVQDIFDLLRGGKVPLVAFNTQGNSLDDLCDVENMLIKGSLLGGKVFIPGTDLRLEEANGNAIISQGTLEAENLEARLGNSWGHGGKLKLGLKKDDHTFHLDIPVQADLAELPPTIRAFVDAKGFQKEISLIQDLRGNAVGRLVLGETREAVKVGVDVSKLNFSAKYQRIPYPLEIGGGHFFYDETRIGVKNLNGKLGNTSFKQLSANIDLEKELYLNVKSADIDFSDEEIFAWLASIEGSPVRLEDIRSVKGYSHITALELKGPLLSPGKWEIKTAYEPRGTVIDSTLLPGPIEITKGKFKGSVDPKTQELSFRDVQIRMLDASMNVSGATYNYFKGLNKVDLSLKGVLGPESDRWVSDLLHLPPMLALRPPISILDGRLLWEKDTKTFFKGDLLVHEGPKLSLDLLQNSQELSMKNTIRDEVSEASTALILGDKKVGLEFKGSLKKETLQNLFLESGFFHGWLEGNFQAYISLDDPMKSTAQGHLMGEDLIFPRELKIPLEIDQISLKAQERHVDVERASLVSGSQKMDLEGSLDFSPPGLVLDMAVKSNGISWTDIEGLLGKRGKENESEQGKAPWNLPVKGTVRLESEYFSYDRFTWFPFRADITFAQNEIDVSVVDAKLCHISTPGSLRITPQDVSLDFDFASRNQELNPSVLCMSGQRSDLTGHFDLLGKVKAQGKADKLLESLNGNVELTARDGRIRRHLPLQRVFAYLNLTKSLSGQLPDISKEEFVYDSITAKATIKDGKVILREGIIDSPSMEIISEGYVDYIRNKIDLMVLVAPLKTIDWVVKKIPLVRRVLQGTLIAVPVKVTGDLSDPKVSPMSASAVGSSLLGIVKRTVQLPIILIHPEGPGTEVRPVEPEE